MVNQEQKNYELKVWAMNADCMRFSIWIADKFYDYDFLMSHKNHIESNIHAPKCLTYSFILD